MQQNRTMDTRTSFPASAPDRRRALTAALIAPALITPALILGTAILAVTTAQAADSPSTRAKRGDAIFHQRCITCHNKQPDDTSPFGPPNLHGIFRGSSAITPRQATEIISKGKGTMPAFSTMLTKSDIDDLIAYLRTQ
jgi:mono/diheme cytochrome c family protein